MVAGGALLVGGAGGVEQPDSGVRGVVLPRSPCPVILERDRCGDQPRRVSIVIRRAHRREWVATIRTDARGRFRKALEPGTYVLQLQRAPQSGPARTVAKRVVVPPHRFVAVIASFSSMRRQKSVLERLVLR